MKRKISIFILILLTVTAAMAAANQTTQYVPESSICMISISGMNSDPGLSWIVDAWVNSPRESGLREIAKSAGFQDMAIAILPPRNNYAIYALLVLQTPKGGDIDTAKLDAVIAREEGITVKTLNHKGKDIHYAETENLGDFSAYLVLDDIALFGADSGVIKAVLDEGSITGGVNFKKNQDSLGASDGLFFTDNSNGQFAGFLAPMEKKWKMSLLLSVDSLESIGCSFDIIDSNKAAGVVIFQGTDNIADIKDDAEFIGEVFKRKFMADKVDYNSEVTVNDKTVTLNIEVEGLEALWTKLFAKGIFSIFVN